MKNELENDLEKPGVGPTWESGDPEIYLFQLKTKIEAVKKDVSLYNKEKEELQKKVNEMKELLASSRTHKQELQNINAHVSFNLNINIIKFIIKRKNHTDVNNKTFIAYSDNMKLSCCANYQVTHAWLLKINS